MASLRVPPTASDALVRLVGARRASLLGRLSSPTSTTALVSATGWSAGSVSEHLSVLADVGLVAKRRAGRTILYWRTELGERLLRANEPDHTLSTAKGTVRA